MGKKKNGGGEAKNKGEGGKKEEGPTPVVLKIDMHCEGCAKRIIKSVRGFDGVEAVKADCETNKITVVGKVDPAELREKLEEKTKKKVELISPPPKKDGGGGGDKKAENKPDKKPDEKKAKEPPVTTAVLMMNLHCEGCVQRIHRITAKTEGVQTHSIDFQNNLVTVKATMDAKALAETLKRTVEIVPPKKDKGDDKKEKGKGGGRGETKSVWIIQEVCSWIKNCFSGNITNIKTAQPTRSTTPTPTLGGLTSPKIIVDDAKRTNDSLSQEVIKLRAQVESLTRKAQLQEVELERTTKQLNEAILIAGEETAKCKAAKEVIKALTAQNLIEQVEPGVYITLTSLPGGVKDLKRVRFSRRRFSEKQAEQWWAENWARVYEQYHVRKIDKSSIGVGGEDFTH